MALAPLHLLLPLWGQRCRDEFLSLGCQCLMWHHNLPVVAQEREVVIQVYTSEDDWQYLKHFTPFSRWGHPIFFRPVPENEKRDRWTSRHQQMTTGHRVMLEAARTAKAIAVPMFADSVLADGDLYSLLQLCTGAPRRFIMGIGFRASHETLVAELQERYFEPLTRRQLVALALKHLHSQMRCWDAQHPAYGDDILGGPQWHVGDRGVVTHSIYWEPYAVDFSFKWPCNTQSVLDWTIDGHFPWANVEYESEYYAITDSDEYFHLTTGRETGPEAYHFDPKPMAGTIDEEFRRARALTSTDPLRQLLAWQQYLVHTHDLSEDAADWEHTMEIAANCEKLSRVPMNHPYVFADHSPWDQDPVTEQPPDPSEQAVDKALETALALIVKQRSE